MSIPISLAFALQVLVVVAYAMRSAWECQYACRDLGPAPFGNPEAASPRTRGESRPDREIAAADKASYHAQGTRQQRSVAGRGDAGNVAGRPAASRQRKHNLVDPIQTAPLLEPGSNGVTGLGDGTGRG
ncbi:hypothetical protein ACL02T_10235 [Pseudonocardia sp. RS010]|uniref:hypothetical protein n=1 Tax=Pseudonocardia sp. RS010 TaxID=3385979 RepID=UPI0039A307B3